MLQLQYAYVTIIIQIHLEINLNKLNAENKSIAKCQCRKRSLKPGRQFIKVDKMAIFRFFSGNE
jgi:hypothetical protein